MESPECFAAHGKRDFPDEFRIRICRRSGELRGGLALRRFFRFRMKAVEPFRTGVIEQIADGSAHGEADAVERAGGSVDAEASGSAGNGGVDIGDEQTVQGAFRAGFGKQRECGCRSRNPYDKRKFSAEEAHRGDFELDA